MKSEINVTPLVDVCLVLLIIFMVVTHEMARGRELPLPQARHQALWPENPEDLVVSVTRDGARTQIWWEQEPLADAAELARRVRGRRSSGSRTFLKADAGLPYGEVYPVLMALHRGGAEGVQLATRGADRE